MRKSGEGRLLGDQREIGEAERYSESPDLGGMSTEFRLEYFRLPITLNRTMDHDRATYRERIVNPFLTNRQSSEDGYFSAARHCGWIHGGAKRDGRILVFS